MGNELLERLLMLATDSPWLNNPVMLGLVVVGVLSFIWLTNFLERGVYEVSRRGPVQGWIRIGIMAGAALAGLAAGLALSSKLAFLNEGFVALVAAVVGGALAAALVFDLCAAAFLAGVGVEALVGFVRRRRGMA